MKKEWRSTKPISDFTWRISSNGNRSPSTVSRELDALKSFYAYQVRFGIKNSNPFDAIRTPKQAKTLPEIFTEREMNAFLDRLTATDFISHRNKAIFEFLYATVLRLSELIGLKLMDINFKDQLVRVMGKGRKERIVPFHSRAGNILQQYIHKAESTFNRPLTDVFLNARGNKISPRGVEMILQETYTRVMGAPTAKSIHICSVTPLHPTYFNGQISESFRSSWATPKLVHHGKIYQFELFLISYEYTGTPTPGEMC